MTAPQPQTNAAPASVPQPVQAAISWVPKHSANSAAIAPRPVSRTEALGSRRGAALLGPLALRDPWSWLRGGVPALICVIEPRAPGRLAGLPQSRLG